MTGGTAAVLEAHATSITAEAAIIIGLGLLLLGTICKVQGVNLQTPNIVPAS